MRENLEALRILRKGRVRGEGWFLLGGTKGGNNPYARLKMCPLTLS